MSSVPRICSRCNAVIPDGHFYCGRCGTRHDESTDGRMQTLFYGPLQSPGRAKLVLVSGEGIEGMSYHLNATEHLCGRTSSVIPFDDPYLSPTHANFFYSDNKLFIRDEGSVNGTFVRLRGPHALQDGDILRAGNHFFRVERLEFQQPHPMSDGTVFYASPSEPLHFRVSVVAEGGVQGAAYASPHHEVSVGREGCDMSFPWDPNMSSRHFKVLDDDGTLKAIDLGSKNGTFVRIRDAVRLQHGDYVFLGQELLRIEIAA